MLKLHEKTKEGLDIVYARREERQDRFLKRYTSKLFYIIIRVSNREEGEFAYSWGSLISLVINNIIAFSDKLLRIAIRIGFFISFVSFSIGIYYLYQFLIREIIVFHYLSLHKSEYYKNKHGARSLPTISDRYSDCLVR